MSTQVYICLAIFAFMILGYLFSGKLKTTLGVIALIAIMLVSFSGIIPASQVLANFASKNVLLITGMFITAAGLNRTQAVHKISAMVYHISKGNFTAMLAGYLLVAFALSSMIPSPMVVFGIVSPLIAASCEDFGVSPSKVMFPLALVAVACCGVLPVGSGATFYAQENGYLESYGYTAYQMEFFDCFIARFPVTILVILYAIFIAPKSCPAQPTTAITVSAAKKGGKEQPPLDPVREVLGYSIFIVTTLALILQSHIGIENWQIAMTGATLVVATGVLKPKEAINAMPVRVVLMLVAALSVGGAMLECGLGDMIGDAIAGILGESRNSYILGGIVFVVPFILTQFMQNQSVIAIFKPIVILTCASLECDPVGPLILLQAAGLTAFMTPSATGTIPMMMDAGGYDQMDLLKMGWLPSILICIVSVGYVMTVFPAF